MWQDARARREDLGVELFGFQQQLRGIFQSLDEGGERGEQLAQMSAAVRDRVAHAERSVATSQALAIERSQQVYSPFPEI